MRGRVRPPVLAPKIVRRRMTMRTSTRISHDSQLAKSLAAEDVRCGDVVAILDMVYEFPSFLWNCDAHVLAPHEPVRVRLRGRRTGEPLRVEAICLPYVLVKTPGGRHATIDVRQCRLVRLTDGYARKTWKRFRNARKRKASCNEQDS